ncbi:MAG: hypothetical protein ACD_20C00362G0003 [uncultured bacterium]|nr:MAG: hypothetical protein ACD_20C00362G0003 [uncultured bacterium]
MDKHLNSQTQDNQQFLTVKEASQLLKTTPKTLYTYLSNTGRYNGKPRKRLPKEVYRKLGRKVLFIKSKLIDWVLSGAELEETRKGEK